MSPVDNARTYLGRKGEADNELRARIVAMFNAFGRAWPQEEPSSWSAAVVGYCIETSGITSTRDFDARSYLGWGLPVRIEDAREGDIVIFKRGRTGKQAHVGFFIRANANSIRVLGGNQANLVTEASYARARLLGIRRTFAPPPAMSAVLAAQKRLRDLGYHEVGATDGELGPRTRGAILAFRLDNQLPLAPDIDDELTHALAGPHSRPISYRRAHGRPEGSRIVSTANRIIGVALLGICITILQGVAPMPAQMDARVADGAISHPAWLQTGLLASQFGVFCLVIALALAARRELIDGYRKGRMP